MSGAGTGGNAGGSGGAASGTGGSTSGSAGGGAVEAGGSASGGALGMGGVPGSGGSTGTGGALTGSGGSGAGGLGTTGGLPDPGSEGDGDSQISPNGTQPDLTDRGAPKGKEFQFTLTSKIYDGKDPTLTSKAILTRTVNVYVPAQFKDTMPAPVMVFGDGPAPNYSENWSQDEYEFSKRALDNLTITTDEKRRIPPFIVVSVQNGGGDSIGSERGLEYDTLSDRYARFIDTEVLPAVQNNASIKAAYPSLKITNNPSGRGALGCSSGSAAAFTMGWFRPDLFSRIVTYSGTLVAQQDPKAPESAMYPHGAWDYHSDKELIKNDTMGREKLLRIFLNANQNDNGATAAESGRHNWLIANQKTAAALKAKGFHYKFVEGMGAGHCAKSVKAATMADALIWVWRGYQPTEN